MCGWVRGSSPRSARVEAVRSRRTPPPPALTRLALPSRLAPTEGRPTPSVGKRRLHATLHSISLLSTLAAAPTGSQASATARVIIDPTSASSPVRMRILAAQ
eukprot:3077040-Prymnesium_polylepis.1